MGDAGLPILVSCLSVTRATTMAPQLVLNTTNARVQGIRATPKCEYISITLENSPVSRMNLIFVIIDSGIQP